MENQSFRRAPIDSAPRILPLEVWRFGQPKTEESKPPPVSCLVAVYNQIHFFELVLASLQRQTFQDFELIICDDGSRPMERRRFFDLAKESGLYGAHLWQPDEGFRKNELLNKAILLARGDYLIFVDGDCVLHPRFIEDHMEFANPQHVLAGRRVNLNKTVSQKLSPEKIRSGWFPGNYFWLGLLNSITPHNNSVRGIWLPSKQLFALFNRKRRGLLGCNFSVHKDNLLKANGFDYRYQKSGTGEDADLEYRLNQLGVRTQSIVQRAIQYHLYHPYTLSHPINHRLFNEMVTKKEWVTPFGLMQIQKALGL